MTLGARLINAVETKAAKAAELESTSPIVMFVLYFLSPGKMSRRVPQLNRAGQHGRFLLVSRPFTLTFDALFS